MPAIASAAILPPPPRFPSTLRVPFDLGTCMPCLQESTGGRSLPGRIRCVSALPLLTTPTCLPCPPERPHRPLVPPFIISADMQRCLSPFLHPREHSSFLSFHTAVSWPVLPTPSATASEPYTCRHTQGAEASPSNALGYLVLTGPFADFVSCQFCLPTNVGPRRLSLSFGSVESKLSARSVIQCSPATIMVVVFPDLQRPDQPGRKKWLLLCGLTSAEFDQVPAKYQGSGTRRELVAWRPVDTQCLDYRPSEGVARQVGPPQSCLAP
ncbi:hypothetical protein K466DRAFT_322234 [Polyporus arcularius HHB13444]|uniref:Uncharacterized protein n=1 Tax=Polyporus arcularius HHB13444 TaxID=1314778 RepID=A0A5C3PPT5_9APHY|nr:hypothetical protein K466DRAFT_322234 [Polyporus arcularius HHB13444]